MATLPKQVTPAPSARESRSLRLGWARLPRIPLALLLLIWAVLPLAPDETGLKFGLRFQVFFTGVLVLGTLFFRFLERDRVPVPQSALGVFASVAGVYLATVGLLVAVAVTFPQFELPRPQEEAGEQQAGERGKTLFLREDIGCFRCHVVAGTGGTRGPDLTQVAARAGSRVPGLPAARYLQEKVRAGATYPYSVPEYVPIMPPFGQVLSDEQMGDLVAYLLSLK